MTRSLRGIAGLFAAGVIGAALTGLYTGYAPSVHFLDSEPAIPAPVVEKAPAIPEPTVHEIPIQHGDNFATVLSRAGVEPDRQSEIIEAVSASFDLRRLRAGNTLTVRRSGLGFVEGIEYPIDPDHKLYLSSDGKVFRAGVHTTLGFLAAVPVCTKLESSLFESIAAVGENPELAIRMAEIFAWDLDFYTDPQEGDEFCILVEKKQYTNGQAATYQRILAAEYVNAGQEYNAFLFYDEEGKPGYYSADGKSLQAAFLRSPMKFDARISSHFSHKRFHPVLKHYRPHLGTDYAAPTGTPVQSIAGGKVVFSARSGGAGNLVRVQHANGYESQYLHLSRRLVKLGQRVDQGQRIGLVGSTGLATGPHLDFRMRRNGQYVNFEGLKVPRATVIPAAQMASFRERRDQLTAFLETAKLAGAPVFAKNNASADAAD